MNFLRDFSFSAFFAGFMAVLVGFTSFIAIVFQAVHAAGASEAETASWMWAIGIGTAVTSMGLSLYYRVPIVTAWSTPGAAMLITSVAGLPLAEIIGAFFVCALLIILFGFTGWFEYLIRHVPIALASAMLAGVLLHFGLNTFVSIQHFPCLVLTMFSVWLLARYWLPRYAVMLALASGIIIATLQGTVHFSRVNFALTYPVFIYPHFSLSAIIGVAVPLFIVTMTSQNVTGVAVLRAHDYTPSISPLIGWTGVATLLLAPFGGFAINLAAIVAAICMGHQAHEDKDRRYVAAVSAGFFYLLMGLFGMTLTTLFRALPEALILAIAGIALLNTIGNSLAVALATETEREAALITFLVTASGLTILGISSAFWGLAAGLIVRGIQRLRSVKYFSKTSLFGLNQKLTRLPSENQKATTP